MIIALQPRDPDLRRAVMLWIAKPRLLYLKTSSQSTGKATSGTGTGSGGSVNGSGTDNHIARFDGTGNIQDSPWVMLDDGEMTLDDGNGLVDIAASVAGGYGISIQPPAGAGGLDIRQYADSGTRVDLSSDGSISLGDGSGSNQVKLSWSAANLLALAAGDAFVIGSTAGDHASTTNGTISYNSTSGKFRAYEAGAWADMIGGGGMTSFTVAGDSGGGQSITNGNTLSILGGVGVDTVDSATDTVTLTVDVTEIEATKTDMENASSSTVAVTPAQTQNHPGVAKFWALINGAATSILNSYNVASINDGGTGNVDVTIGTDFNGTSWAPFVSVERPTGTSPANQRIGTIESGTIAAGVVSGICYDTTATTVVLKDPNNWMIMGMGYQ